MQVMEPDTSGVPVAPAIEEPSPEDIAATFLAAAAARASAVVPPAPAAPAASSSEAATISLQYDTPLVATSWQIHSLSVSLLEPQRGSCVMLTLKRKAPEGYDHAEFLACVDKAAKAEFSGVALLADRDAGSDLQHVQHLMEAAAQAERYRCVLMLRGQALVLRERGDACGAQIAASLASLLRDGSLCRVCLFCVI